MNQVRKYFHFLMASSLHSTPDLSSSKDHASNPGSEDIHCSPRLTFEMGMDHIQDLKTSIASSRPLTSETRRSLSRLVALLSPAILSSWESVKPIITSGDRTLSGL